MKGNLNNGIKYLVLFSFICTILQIFLGSLVRQFIDIQNKNLGNELKNIWLDPAPIKFYVHRSFSIFIIFLNFLIYLILKRNNYSLILINLTLLIIILEITTGAIMFYFDFPFRSQPIHLVLASALFGLQSYLVFKIFKI